ncbi:MAG: hypothetical protein FWB85_10815 [Chitinispirillia bacterium]|nr:hypothetical protein [Chitinispirillia bacterium]
MKDPENASKVVNENGEPLVVYHGARTLEDFTVFRPGKIFFVNNRDVAEMFRSDHAYKLIVDGEEHGISESTANDIKAVLEPHEDLEWATGWNLLEDTGKTTEDFNELIEDGALQTGLDSFDGAKEIRIERNNASLYEAYLNIRNPKIIDAGGRGWTGDMEHNEWIFDGGHDGIIVKNIVEGGLAAEMPDGSEPPPATNYIVKNSNQIKSATDNRGTFDGANPDIRFSRRGGAGNNYITPSGRDVSQAGASGERMSTEIDGWDGVANLPSMEEARRSVQHSHRVHLEKIWDAAIKNKGDHPYSLGSPTPRLLEEIGRVLGRKVNAKHQIITLGYTRHINKSHGVGGRSVAGQVPVTRERFSLIPDVLKNFDTVEVGHETRGGDGVLIRKRYADGEAVLVDVVPVKGNLEIRSYRIDKASGRGRQLSNYVSQADVSPDYTSETHRDTPATTNNLPHSPPKVNTLPENNSDVAFSERYDLTTDQYRERDRDPRWAVAAAVQGILADEGITLPGWGGELSASPGPAGLFTFAGAVQNWGRARTDEGRKKWARAEERLMDWVHEHPDVVAAAGFSEALDTTFGRDDRFNLRDLVDAIPEWLADFNAGRFQPGDGEINTNNPDGASSQIDRIEADVRGEGGAGSASGSDASGGLRARFDATPTVWVSGKEMFDFAEPLDMRAIRTKTIEWMAEQGYFRNDYKNADAGWDNIHITARGANNSLQHGAGPEKIQSFAALPRVIKSGVLIKTKPGKSHQSDMKEHIFAAKLDIGNKPMLVGFVIKEDSNGKRFYDHEMTSIISLGEVPSQVGADGPNTQNAVRPRQGSILNILKESLGVNILNENNYNQNANVPKSRPWNEEERGSWREDEWDEWERRQRWERDIRRDVRREERKKKKEQEQEQESRQKKMRRDLREEIREGNKERKRARSARVQEQRRQRREADAFVDEALRAVRAQDRARSSRSSSVDQQAHAEIDAFLRETMGVDDRMVRDFRRARMIIERRATLNEIDYNSLNLSETQKAQYKEWVDGQPGSEMPQAILDRYDELYNAVVAGRTADEIAQLRDKLKSITAAGRVRVSLNRMLELMDRSEQVHEMLKQVGAIFGRDPTPEEKKAGKFRVDIRYVHHQKADDRDKGAVTRVRQSLKEWAVEIDYESLSPETIIRIWDGSMGKSDEAIESSPFFKNIFGKILNCWTARLTNLERATERFNECMRPIAGLMDKKAEKEFREDLEFLEKKPAGPERDKAIRKLHEKRDRAIGKFINDKRSQVLVTVPIEDRAGATSDKKITIDEAMFVYAHSQNEDGRTHLRGALDDDGERVGGSYGSGYYPSMDAIIDALPEEFKQAVDNVIDYFDNEQYPRVNPVFAREHLIDMLKSDRYVPMRNLEMEGKSIAEVLKMEDSLRRASLKKGATKGRVGSDLAFANPSFFGTVIPAIREVEHYIAFNDAVRDINGLLGDDNLRRALEQKHPEGLRMVEEWIVDTASDKTPPPKDVISKFAAKLKGLYTVGVLGFNFLTTVKQLDSWTQGMARISGGWWRVPSVLLRAPSQFHSVWALAQNNSVMMRHRARDIERGLTEMAGHPDFTREIELRLGKRGIEIDVAGAVAMWRQAAMWTIQTADMIVTTSLWVAKFESRFNELYALQRKKGMPEEEARDWARKAASVSADALIRRTQPMFDKVVAPKSLRSGNPLVRMFGMFINQQNKNWNNLHDTLMGLHNRGLLKTAILGAMTHVVPGIIFYTLSSGRVSLDTGDDEWEDAWKAMWRSDWGDAAQRAAGAAENYNILNNPLNPLKWNVPIEEWIDTMAENNFAGVPGFGLIPIAAVRAGTNYIRVARGRAANWSPAVSLSPVTDMASKGVGLARNAGRQAIEKDLMDAAKLGSQAAGLPAWIQANRIINALEAEDWRRLIWSRNALKDKGVFANMALMANGQVGAVDPKTGKWKDGPFDKFLRWYRDLDRPEQERFDRYYNNVLDEKADEDQESEYKLVRAYDGSENPLQRRWAKNRQALWGVEGRRSYDEWEDKQATDREGRMDAKEAANQFLEKVISNRGSVTTK